MGWKITLAVVALVVLLALTVRARAANVDVSGTWKGSFEFGGDSYPLTLHLTAAGNTLTGTVEGLPTTPAEIHDGKISGNKVTFWLNTDYEGNTYKLAYTGTVSADQISFMFGTEDGSWSTPMTVTRNAEAAPAAPETADVTGTWKGSFDYDGNNVVLTFHLTAASGVVTGTVEGLPTTPAEVHEGKLDGDTVTFWVLTDYQGQTYKLVYTGKVSAEKIAFNFGTDDGGWSTTLTATKAM
ncbi:MAG TPA: hypothetical protein VGR47_01540 [Terracidiphilus sp.]|nr:hypothetical protein [Terracidiphilus sp.]